MYLTCMKWSLYAVRMRYSTLLKGVICKYVFFFLNIPPSCLSSVSFSCISSESLKYLQWMDPAPPAAAGKPKMGELVLLCIVTREPDLLFVASWGRRVRWETQCGGSWMKSRTTTILILPVGSKDEHFRRILFSVFFMYCLAVPGFCHSSSVFSLMTI